MFMNWVQPLLDIGAPSCILVGASRFHRARHVQIDSARLVLVVHGTKQIRGDGMQLSLKAGDLMLVTRPCQGDVINTPDPEVGRYVALVIPLDGAVLSAARLLMDGALVGVAPQREPAVLLNLRDWTPSLQRWGKGLVDGDAPNARLALTSMVLALCGQGHGQLLVPVAPTLTTRIQALVQADPARAWMSGDFEDALNISGATLRRRMAEEDTCLRDQIRLARLARALEWLYTTSWPIKTLAARVGYQSPASFVRQFRARYGMEPGDIGNAIAA